MLSHVATLMTSQIVLKKHELRKKQVDTLHARATSTDSVTPHLPVHHPLKTHYDSILDEPQLRSYYGSTLVTNLSCKTLLLPPHITLGKLLPIASGYVPMVPPWSQTYIVNPPTSTSHYLR